MVVSKHTANLLGNIVDNHMGGAAFHPAVATAVAEPVTAAEAEDYAPMTAVSGGGGGGAAAATGAAASEEDEYADMTSFQDDNLVAVDEVTTPPFATGCSSWFAVSVFALMYGEHAP